MNSSPLLQTRERLRIAMQKSGRLADPTRALLEACGLNWRQSRDRLFCYGQTLPIDILLVRDDDIPNLIADGVCDLGVVGRNELEEQAAERKHRGMPCAFHAIRSLQFSSCRLMIAIPEDWQWSDMQQIAGLRIATSYPAITRDWLKANHIDAQIVELSGSVEIAPRLGTADVICDLVSSGATLAANQLKPVYTVLESQAMLIGAMQAPSDSRSGIMSLLLRRIDGVMQARDQRLIMFHAKEQHLPALRHLLADANPLVRLPDDGSGTLKMQTMCSGPVSWQRLEALEQAGAKDVMVLSVECALR